MKVAKAVGAGLVKQGFDVIYTRIADNYVNLGERCRIANTKKAALFVSIHANSAQNTTANGIETLCYAKNSLAEITQKELVSALKLKDRGVKERKDLYVLNGTEMPAILVELGFLSNVNDANVMRKNGFENIAANAIVSGICKYFGINKKITEDMEMVENVVMGVGGVDKEVKRILKDGENYVRLRDLEGVLKVNYDSATKKVSVYKK